MASLDPLIAAWDEGHWELSEALRDLPDEDVWKRPHPALLSVGELVGHIAHWEAAKLTGQGLDNRPDLEKVPIKSPLVDTAFHYYTSSIGEPIDLGLTTAELQSEITRIHDEIKASLTAEERDSADPVPGYEKATWGGTLRYQVFHVAYHTGQIYSVRHLLGHTPPDN